MTTEPDAGTEQGKDNTPSGEPTGVFSADAGQETTPPAACTDSVDVVFVLDVSSSMDFVLDQLGRNIESVVQEANKLGRGGAHFGLVTFVDNARIDTTGDMEGGQVHTKPSSLQSAFREAKKTYTDPNRNPGDGPKGPTTQNPICEENALDALHMAAVQFPWRNRATRVVIVATDDTFLQFPDNYGDRDGDGKTDKTNYPREGDYPAKHTLSETVTALRGNEIRVFSFTRLSAPSFFSLSRCSTGRRLEWSSISDGWSTPYRGMAPIPDQTSGKNFDLDRVRDESLSLSSTINEVVVQSYCNPPR
jgi:hypothetical protein